MKGHTRDRRWALAILLLGSLQMVGGGLGVPALVGLGAASHVSPAPKVFTVVEGAEPFSATFLLELEDESGAVRSLPLDREHYERLGGPYNRRNVVGAVVAGGPPLRDHPHLGPMMTAAARHALCGEAPVLVELEGPGQPLASVVTIVQSGRDGSELRWTIAC